MNLRIFVLTTVLAVLALGAGSPLPTEAGAGFIVTRTDDPAPNGCVPFDCSLREAVIDANVSPGHDTITLGPGTHTLSIPGVGEDAAATGDLDINEDATIVGAGSGTTTVNADGLDRAFDIGVGIFDLITVEISGLTVRNGDVGTDVGGGIRVYGSSGDMLVLNDVELRNNSAGRGGGLGSGAGSGASLTDVTVRNNVAFNSGSPATADGGGIYHCCSNTGSFSLVRGQVYDNYAQSDGGGVFFCCSSGATLQDVVISSNDAGFDGGGLYHCCNDMVMDVTNAVIDNNTAGRDGGGVFNCCAGMSVNLVNVTISANQAAGGGGVFNRDNGGGIVNLLNATITDNTASDGGGVFNNPVSGVLSLTNTIVAGNDGGDCGGDVGSAGHNIDGDGTCGLSASGDMSGVDPLLGSLAENGGFSQTHALLPGSPAIDNASNPDCPDTDQRGVHRPQGPSCDIGAFELEPGGSTPTPSPTPTAAPTASPTPTPTGTPAPGTNAIWGDDDCNGAVAATDALKNLQEIASIPYTQTEPCFPIGDPVGVTPAGADVYPWGDVDCNKTLAATDALAILRSIAGLSVTQEPGCPEIGDPVLVQQ